MTLLFAKRKDNETIVYYVEKGVYERKITRPYPCPTVTVTYLTKEELLAELEQEQENHMKVIRELQDAINDLKRY